jgi:thiazole synthase
MIIILNGDPLEIGGPMTVSALLLQLGVDARRVAVEHNLNVIKRANYDHTEIREGDQIEIVNFVGGGGGRGVRGKGQGQSLPRRSA